MIEEEDTELQGDETFMVRDALPATPPVAPWPWKDCGALSGEEAERLDVAGRLFTPRAPEPVARSSRLDGRGVE
jgi:hypothetical protein